MMHSPSTPHAAPAKTSHLLSLADPSWLDAWNELAKDIHNPVQFTSWGARLWELLMPD